MYNLYLNLTAAPENLALQSWFKDGKNIKDSNKGIMLLSWHYFLSFYGSGALFEDNEFCYCPTAF